MARSSSTTSTRPFSATDPPPALIVPPPHGLGAVAVGGPRYRAVSWSSCFSIWSTRVSAPPSGSAEDTAGGLGVGATAARHPPTATTVAATHNATTNLGVLTVSRRRGSCRAVRFLDVL